MEAMVTLLLLMMLERKLTAEMTMVTRLEEKLLVQPQVGEEMFLRLMMAPRELLAPSQ